MNSLGLKAGEWVEVRSREEILATLDRNASLEGMPFMPEMLRYCGQRLRVFKRAHKTCDTAEKTGGRRVPGTIHLEDVRCDGSGHGGCQAGCMIFWKEAWLKRADGPGPAATAQSGVPADELIERGAYFSGRGGPPAQVRWRCQANELFRASSPLPWWDFRQYAEDLASRNIGLAALARGAAFSVYRRLVEIGVGYRFLVGLWDRLARVFTELGPYPMRQGRLTKTPTEELGLQPGEWVRVKSYPEILATLDASNKNRGLFFDVEATRFCGRAFRVASRVTQILDEKTGEMLHFKNPCIVLEQVWCGGELSKHRVFCPRAIYPYWREIWLERVAAPEPGGR